MADHTTRRRKLRGVLVAVAALALPLLAQGVGQATQAPASHDGAAKPYLGWSSWSLQSTNYPGVNPNGNYSYLTESNVLANATVLATKLAGVGYEYVNVDSGWFADWNWNFHIDAYGRPARDTARFPDPMPVVAAKIHRMGLKFGLYYPAGLYSAAYDANTPIYGSEDGCTTQRAVLKDANGKPEPIPNQWTGWYALDFSAGNPCGYEYIRSVADMFASWGVDFLKIDGVTPGSANNNPASLADSSYYEVAAWHSAFDAVHWRGQILLSYSIPVSYAPYWQRNSNGVRVDNDVECYCGTLVGGWTHSLTERWQDVVPWLPYARPGFWPNLDSLDVGNGVMDGLTRDERQSYMTLWAIEAAPLYLGDDLTKLDSYGISLLTNREVIAVDQAARPAHPVSQATQQQVWFSRDADGSYTVALFNLGDTAATVTANWSDVGFSGSAAARDLWTHTDLGRFTGGFATTVPAHGSRLLRVTPRR